MSKPSSPLFLIVALLGLMSQAARADNNYKLRDNCFDGKTDQARRDRMAADWARATKYAADARSYFNYGDKALAAPYVKWFGDLKAIDMTNAPTGLLHNGVEGHITDIPTTTPPPLTSVTAARARLPAPDVVAAWATRPIARPALPS